MKQLQLQPQRHRQTETDLLSGLKKAAAAAAEAIVDACEFVKEKVGELLGPDKPAIQQTAVTQASKVSVGVSTGVSQRSAVQTDGKRELVRSAFLLLGEVETQEKVEFFETLQTQTGFEVPDLALCLKFLLDTGLSFSEMMGQRVMIREKVVFLKDLHTRTGYGYKDISSCLKCLLDIGTTFSELMDLLEETCQKVVFLKTLHTKTGVSFPDIVSCLKLLLGTGLSFRELMDFKVENVTALFLIWLLRGKFKQATTPDTVYIVLLQQGPTIGVRVNGWMEKMMVAIARPAAPTGKGDLEDILRDYVSFAADEIIVPFEWAFRLFRLAIRMAGYDMPSIDTLKMTALWGLMLSDMCKSAPGQESILQVGVALLAMWISLASHINTDDIASSYGSVMKALSEETPEKIKNKFYTLLQRIGDSSMDAKKYLAWNKTVGVLIENESLDMAGAMRMMSTFTVGRTFASSLSGQFNLMTFLRDLSPIPGRGAIHDILTLFRLPAEYKRRTEKIYNELDGLVKGKPSDEDFKKASGCYCELVKLKLSFVPYQQYGPGGGFVDPNGTPIDDAVIDIISIYAFSSNNNGLINRMRRRQFKSHLRNQLIKSPDVQYLTYFGEPHRPKRKEVPQITYE